MSKFHPPEAFTFHKPTEWPVWKARFSRFRLATEVHKNTGDVQLSALVYAMGPEAEHVIQSHIRYHQRGNRGLRHGAGKIIIIINITNRPVSGPLSPKCGFSDYLTIIV